MPAILEHLHIVPRRRAGPVPIEAAELRPGRGVPGDHHDREGIRRPVTAVRAETLDDVATLLGRQPAPGASRRNLTIRGLELDALPPGTRLLIGTAELEITGPCDPCDRMETALGAGALERMRGRGGVVLKVVRAGTLRRGDLVTARAPGKPKPIVKRTPRAKPPVTSDVVEPAGGATRVRALQRDLLAWFRASKRDLPWRRTRDPYAIWLSEVMLQQTQVATVIPFWERFLERFPTVRALAAARLDEVLPYWSGLGYYARCRHLHRAAQAVVERHAGEFPADLVALEALPGFGPYTAGAVGSIALGLDASLVDGNVARVLCRLEGWTLGAEAARERAWLLAPALVPAGEAGDWNQALMELGATVCAPVPKCGSCPVRARCEAAERGEAPTYPLAKERRPKKLLALAAIAVRDGLKLLLVRRPDEGLFGGLWELPSVELSPDADAPAAAAELANRLFSSGSRLERLGRVEQTLTHREVVVDVFEATGTGVRPPAGARWVGPDEARALGLSTLAVKLLHAARFEVPHGHGRRRAVRVGQATLFDPG